MKKKLVLMAILLIIGVILFLENVCKISIFYNMKNIIDKQSKMYNNEEKITKLNVTGIEPGKETDHEHLYKTVYDENKHWKECMACGEKINNVEHSFERTWASESKKCIYTNYYTDTCTCGYSYIGHKPCVWDGKSYITNVAYQHFKKCSNCEGSIRWSYYYQGKLIEEYTGEDCYKANGSKISCLNLGKCNKCSYTHSNATHCLKIGEEINNDGKRNIYCIRCNANFGKATQNVTRNTDNPGTYTVIEDLELVGATFSRTNSFIGIHDAFDSITQTITNGYIGNTNVTIKTVVKFKSSCKIASQETRTRKYVKINGIDCLLDSDFIYTKPDITPPVISNIVTDNEELLTIWSRTKPIIISGTENYCDNINIEIIDDEKNIIFNGKTVVKNGSYTISCTPELEVGTSGKKFKAIVTDSCDNKTEQEFEIARVDAIAPRITSRDELGGEWAKSEKITFSANDYGIGEVQIGFNSSDDYILASKDGQSYSREYELFGDVYEPREANVYYKDGLGNISTKKIIINKLDNTVPTITNVNIHNNKLTVEANDIHEIWGEGSGIVKYRYLSSGEKIGNIDESILINEIGIEENIVIPNLPEVKYVYIVAEDLVRKYKQNI